MYYLADFKKSRKEKRDVKSHTRRSKDGKISVVKRYARNFLIGGGLLGAGMLLGKSRSIKPPINNISQQTIKKATQQPIKEVAQQSIEKVVKQPIKEVAQQSIEKVKPKVDIEKVISESTKPTVPKGSVFLDDVVKKTNIAEISPNEIDFDPKRFQYKILGRENKRGSVGSLGGVKKYDENLSGILQVWKDPKNNKTYVVNGHNRLALAKDLGVEKVAVRYLKADNYVEARSIGALTNIAEGKGTAIDAGKFFRDTNLTKEDLIKRGIPMQEKIAQDGMSLSNLDDWLFKQTVDGRLPQDKAIIIGGSGLDKRKQRDLFEILVTRKSIGNDVFAELVGTVKAAEQQTMIIPDLFGGSEEVISNALERARLQDNITKRLRDDKNLFKTVSRSKNTTKLSQAGSTINVETSKTISENAQAYGMIFEQFKNYTGPISDILNSAATEVRDFPGRKKTIYAKAYRDIVAAIKQELNTGKR